MLSAYVLVLVFYFDYRAGQAAVAIDMPDRATCIAAGEWAVSREAKPAYTFMCIGREAR